MCTGAGNTGLGPTLIPQLHPAIIPSLVTDPISVMILLMDTCYYATVCQNHGGYVTHLKWVRHGYTTQPSWWLVY